MKVLSLFDGISCGMVAFERAGIPVTEYHACEIDRHAIKISEKNYPQIVRHGSVTDYHPDRHFDYLIGGSPCQGFSFAGKQLNFNDPRSALFFEFVRLLKETNPKYFLLENVRMKKEYEDVITSYLGVNPITINSALVSAQNRVRLYWTNIPNVTLPEDKGILLEDLFESNTDEKIYTEPYYKINDKKLSYLGYVGNAPKQATKVFSTKGKSVCLTALGGGQGGKTGLYEIPNTRTCRKLTVTECERLQTVPIRYTEGVSNTARYKMLGNGWTVEVIEHIFRNMNEL